MNITNFFGNNKVRMGDGRGLFIKHVGQSSFFSPYNSKLLSKTFYMFLQSPKAYFVSQNLLLIIMSSLNFILTFAL